MLSAINSFFVGDAYSTATFPPTLATDRTLSKPKRYIYLPQEVLVEIFSKLPDTASLISCCKVCREWNQAAQSMVYGVENIGLRTLDQFARYAEHARSVRFLDLSAIFCAGQANISEEFTKTFAKDSIAPLPTLIPQRDLYLAMQKAVIQANMEDVALCAEWADGDVQGVRIQMERPPEVIPAVLPQEVIPAVFQQEQIYESVVELNNDNALINDSTGIESSSSEAAVVSIRVSKEMEDSVRKIIQVVLARSPNMRTLVLNNLGNIVEDSLCAVIPTRKLCRLAIAGSRVSDTGIQSLCEPLLNGILDDSATALESSCPPLVTKPPSQLPTCLSHLDISHCFSLTDKSIEALCQWPNLQDVTIQGRNPNYTLKMLRKLQNVSLRRYLGLQDNQEHNVDEIVSFYTGFPTSDEEENADLLNGGLSDEDDLDDDDDDDGLEGALAV